MNDGEPRAHLQRIARQVTCGAKQVKRVPRILLVVCCSLRAEISPTQLLGQNQGCLYMSCRAAVVYANHSTDDQKLRLVRLTDHMLRDANG